MGNQLTEAIRVRIMLKEMSENWILYKSSAKYGVRKTETERIEDLETQSKEQQREKN